MNKISGTVSKIQSTGDLRLIELKVCEDTLSAVILDNPLNEIIEGESVTLLFKETEVAIAVEFTGKISLRNQLSCLISGIEKGKILTSVKLSYNDYSITSIITTSSAESLGLYLGLKVTAFIKTNELMIMESSSELKTRSKKDSGE